MISSWAVVGKRKKVRSLVKSSKFNTKGSSCYMIYSRCKCNQCILQKLLRPPRPSLRSSVEAVPHDLASRDRTELVYLSLKKERSTVQNLVFLCHPKRTWR